MSLEQYKSDSTEKDKEVATNSYTNEKPKVRLQRSRCNT